MFIEPLDEATLDEATLDEVTLDEVTRRGDLYGSYCTTCYKHLCLPCRTNYWFRCLILDAASYIGYIRELVSVFAPPNAKIVAITA